MSFLEFLAGLGAAQGILLLVLIGLRFRHHENLPLALLVLVFSLRLGTIPFWNAEALLRAPWLWPATTPLPFLFGPLLWWFIRNIAADNEKGPRGLVFHFTPYIAEVTIITISILGMDLPEYREFVVSVFAGSPPYWLPIRNALKVVVNIIYLVLSARIVFGCNSRDIPGSYRYWLRILVVLPSLVLAAFAFVAVYPPATARLAAGGCIPFIILAAAMAVLVYVISFLVLAVPQVLTGGHGSLSGGRSGREELCAADESAEISEKVKESLDAGAFHDTRLSLNKLAKRLDIHPNRVSYVINHVYKQSFCSLVNDYRLRYFQNRVDEGALNNHSILELAMEAGFSSKSTFNRVFKEATGISPSVYAQQYRGLTPR
ncbi:AraC family transcriptional regulator [Marispirochaeta sp.]|uniref:helix-turn-helix domain-containing protein n=1 Tax=Marispirochaeta sp. TaxID=2038653 RepID=UPI0029C6D846|nr:AraC family transcriptional regulator [Marispirochaeta sp.]